jgi:hypothetical protein
MTGKTLKTLSATFIAAALATGALTLPANAGGSVSITYTPQSQKDAQKLQAGLLLYQIYNAVQNGASIKQIGKNNAAGIAQYGYGNTGIIHQDGKGHSATLNQYGNGNSWGIFQFGKNTNADVYQYGNGGTGATFQFGW